MPGMWVQERFNPAQLPTGGQSNTWSRPWITIGPTEPSQAGIFNVPDNLWYIWPGPAPYRTWPIPQQYWAATRYTKLGEPGVFVGNWTIELVPGTVTHVKN